MAYTRDVQNVGRGQGASGAPTLTTGATVAAGARIFLEVIMDAGAGTVTADSVSGGSLTWIRLATLQDASKSSCSALFYADAPTGMPSSTTLTVTVTGTHFDWTTVASSYLGAGWVQNGATDTTTQVTGTTWISNNVTLPGAGIVITGAGFRTPGSGPSGDTNTPASGSTEDNDANNSVSGSSEEIAIIESRIETAGGNYSNGGTIAATATDGGGIITAAFSEPVGGSAGPIHPMVIRLMGSPVQRMLGFPVPDLTFPPVAIAPGNPHIVISPRTTYF